MKRRFLAIKILIPVLILVTALHSAYAMNKENSTQFNTSAEQKKTFNCEGVLSVVYPQSPYRITYMDPFTPNEAESTPHEPTTTNTNWPSVPPVDSSDSMTKKEFVQGEMFLFSNVNNNDETASVAHTFTIERNTDLYFYGLHRSIIKSIAIVNSQTDITYNIGNTRIEDGVVLLNLPDGAYSFSVNLENITEIDGGEIFTQGAVVPPISYEIAMYAVPSIPPVILPDKVNHAYLSVFNDYSHLLIISVNGRTTTITSNDSASILLDEGNNQVNYYAESKHGKSKEIRTTIVCDTTLPSIRNLRAVCFQQTSLLIEGTLSEDVKQLSINGTSVQFGYDSTLDTEICFAHYIYDNDIQSIELVAVDLFDNVYRALYTLQW